MDFSWYIYYAGVWEDKMFQRLILGKSNLPPRNQWVFTTSLLSHQGTLKWS